MSIQKLKTGFFGGAWINDVKHYFTKINEIIDVVNDIPEAPTENLKYVAYISQDSTSAPTVVRVLKDTIGDISFTYVVTGQYSIVSPTLFADLSKVTARMNSITKTQDMCTVFLTVGGEEGDSLYINTQNLATPRINKNGVLIAELIEIEIYP